MNEFLQGMDYLGRGAFLTVYGLAHMVKRAAVLVWRLIQAFVMFVVNTAKAFYKESPFGFALNSIVLVFLVVWIVWLVWLI